MLTNRSCHQKEELPFDIWHVICTFHKKNVFALSCCNRAFNTYLYIHTLPRLFHHSRDVNELDKRATASFNERLLLCSPLLMKELNMNDYTKVSINETLPRMTWLQSLILKQGEVIDTRTLSNMCSPLVNLTHLNIKRVNIHITSKTVFGRVLKNLTHLQISSLNAKLVEQISMIPQLKKLSIILQSNAIGVDFSVLTNIEELSIKGETRYNRSLIDPHTLKNMKLLKRLKIKGYALHLTQIRALNGITSLDLSNMAESVIHESAEGIMSIPTQLTTLKINPFHLHDDVTVLMPNALKENITHLTLMNWYSHYTRAGPFIDKLINLEKLSILSCSFVPRLEEFVQHLTKLTTIRIGFKSGHFATPNNPFKSFSRWDDKVDNTLYACFFNLPLTVTHIETNISHSVQDHLWMHYPLGRNKLSNCSLKTILNGLDI